MSEREDGPDRQVRLAEERTELAAARTRDAVERTLMAWIRTTLSMIGFGFGIFKVDEYVEPPGHATHATASIALALVALGTLLLIGAMLQYRAALRRLHVAHPQSAGFPLAFLGAVAVALIGLFALLYLLNSEWGVLG